MSPNKIHSKTLTDLKLLEEIENRIDDLISEKELILKNCSHLNTIPKIVETFQWEKSPRSVCVVCGENFNNLTLSEKVSCFKEYFEGYHYSEEDINTFANEGGCNLDWGV